MKAMQLRSDSSGRFATSGKKFFICFPCRQGRQKEAKIDESLKFRYQRMKNSEKNRVFNGDLFRLHDGMLRSTVAGKCFSSSFSLPEK